MCCNIKYVKKYITVKIIKIDLINFERNFIGPSVPIKSKQNHATFGHSWNHNKDLAILCFYRYFSTYEKGQETLWSAAELRSVRAATALCVFLQYISSVQFWCSAGTLDNNSAAFLLLFRRGENQIVYLYNRVLCGYYFGKWPYQSLIGLQWKNWFFICLQWLGEELWKIIPQILLLVIILPV